MAVYDSEHEHLDSTFTICIWQFEYLLDRRHIKQDKQNHIEIKL